MNTNNQQGDNQQTAQITDEQAQAIQQQLADALGISDLPEDKQQEVLERAGELILKRLFRRVMDALSNEEKRQFDEFLGQSPAPKQEEAAVFLSERIPNLEEMRKEEVEKLKEEFQLS